MTRGRSIVLGLLLAPMAAGAASAQTGDYAGTVVFAGVPVSGATVWLQCDTGTAARLIETRSDPQGKFRLRDPNGKDDRAIALIARAADGRIGWRLLGRRGHWDDSAADDLRIELLPVGAARGRLSDAAGKPIARAKITVNGLQPSKRDGARTQGLYDMPPALARLFEASTKDDGSFALSGIPLGGSLHAMLATEDYKDVLLGWQQGQTGEFRLEPPGRVRICFKGATHVEKLAGLALGISTRPPATAGATAGSFVNYYKEVTSAGTETLLVVGVLPGKGQIRLHSNPSAPYFASEVVRIVVKPGATTEATLVVAPAAHVRGRVIDQQTRKGVAGARIAIQSRDQSGKHLASVTTPTGADGAFAAYVRPGRLAVYLSGEVPAGYVAPASKRQGDEPVMVAGGAEHVFPDIALEPALPLHGVVVDERGKPVPGVAVHSAAWQPMFETADPRTDEQGRFVLKTLGARRHHRAARADCTRRHRWGRRGRSGADQGADPAGRRREMGLPSQGAHCQRCRQADWRRRGHGDLALQRGRPCCPLGLVARDRNAAHRTGMADFRPARYGRAIATRLSFPQPASPRTRRSSCAAKRARSTIWPSSRSCTPTERSRASSWTPRASRWRASACSIRGTPRERSPRRPAPMAVSSSPGCTTVPVIYSHGSPAIA